MLKQKLPDSHEVGSGSVVSESELDQDYDNAIKVLRHYKVNVNKIPHSANL